MQNPMILTKQIGSLYIIRLNRPDALNALSHDMLIDLKAGLEFAFQSPEIDHIWLESSSEHAFCSGGDVKHLVNELRVAPDQMKHFIAKEYFDLEYQVDLMIEESPKPIVAFCSGLCLGGGWGLFAGANLRLCTPQASFAMPEISIGFYPDVGAGHFLQVENWKIGTFIGISGVSLSADEALALNYVDGVIVADYASTLKHQLSEGIDVTELNIDTLSVNSEVLDAWNTAVDLLPDEGLLNDWISVAEASENLPPFMEARKNWEQCSAWSVAVTWELFKKCRSMSRKEVLSLDSVAAANFAQAPDFIEGITARLIDKHRSPNWKYPHVESVPLMKIMKGFE